MKINGESNFLGFMIYDEDGRKIKSKKYDKGRIILSGMYVSAISIFLCPFLLLVVFGAIDRLDIIISLASLAVAIFLVNIFLSVKNDAKEWHATEHKLINLLGDGQKLTLENLKKATIYHPMCGEWNNDLKEPTQEKLNEAVKVGQEYLVLIKKPKN